MPTAIPSTNTQSHLSQAHTSAAITATLSPASPTQTKFPSLNGANDPALQGYFDLSGIPLPPGMTTANYQVTFESVNPLYILTNAVGPYAEGQVAPSGTLQSINVPN